MCIALVNSGRFVEAGQAADRILKLGGASPMAHYAAAVGLLFESGSPNEALAHLRSAQRQIPNARIVAARVLANTGRRADAAREVEAYLQSRRDDARRPKLEAWLAELRQ